MSCWKASASREFDAWSRTYDRSLLQRVFFRPAHDAVLQLAKLPAAGDVLDIGCGTGRLLGRMADAFPEAKLTGLDLSTQMLEKATHNLAPLGARVALVHGDSEHLPFADSGFDLVTCVHSFHHYPNQQQSIAEMSRVLRPGGQLLLVDGDRDGWWGWCLYDLGVAAVERLVHHCSGRRFQSLAESGGLAARQHRRGRFLPYRIVEGRTPLPKTTGERQAA